MTRKIYQKEREEQIHRLCKGTQYSFISWHGEYKNGRSKFFCKCEFHGEWLVCSEKFVNSGTRCRVCSAEKNRKKLTVSVVIREKQINQRCQETSLKFLGWTTQYENNESVITLECAKHGIFNIRFSKFALTKQGCSSCGRERQIKSAICDAKVRMAAIENACGIRGYTFVKWVKSTGKCSDKLIISCPEHGRWSVSISHFLNHKTGCPTCGVGGYKSNKEGFLYLLVSECGGYVKIGITNDISRRMKELRYNTPFSFEILKVKNFKSGEDAKKWEMLFHSNFENASMRNFDGATEWVKWNNEIPLWFDFI